MRKSIIFILTLLIFFLESCSIDKGSSSSVDPSKYSTYLATPDNPVVSPSGKYQLSIVEGVSNKTTVWTMKITDLSSDTSIDLSDSYRIRDALFILWDNDDRVWVYSGDVGIFFWEKEGDSWIKKSYVEEKEHVNPPDILKELRPRYFS